ncbi:adhesion G-protein coupled receptor G4 [Nephila pilipes]|uniref:Adhesion G-protein coupled receptor G4 n=1 Tax=Nephila pilipes TaxID=299642 RepID=A0A8X6NCR6_NEPPI|nr:adhesion G-protein coupled receptor G4 [Nephila pilipes]
MLNQRSPGYNSDHTSVSMLMNSMFVVESLKGHGLWRNDVCNILSFEEKNHYFYQYVKVLFFFSGIPFIIVGVTVLMDWEVYYNRNEYCMLSASNPYVYYISFLGPSCLILFVNLTVFLMVTRVLFTPRNVSAKKPPQCSKKEKILVTTAQVRGAFTVMVR